MRKFVLVALLAAVFALTLVAGETPAQASHGIFNVHVHDDYFHPAGTFGVPTDHNLAKAACQKASPDAACDSTIHVGDPISFVSPAPLATNPHSVQECSDGTFTNCSIGADPNNPIGYSGVRNPPSPGPSGWPYTTAPFTTPGTYYFRCDVHPDVMRGRVVVIPASVGGFVQLADSDAGHHHYPGMDMSASPDSAFPYLLLAGAISGALAVVAISAGGLCVRQHLAARRLEDDD